MEAPPKGPFVQGAFFCERVLEEKTGTLSAIRIVDRVTHTVSGPDAPQDMTPFDYNITLLVMLKAGGAVGRQNFTLSITPPSGIKRDIGSGSVSFGGGEAEGVNIPMNLTMRIEHEGIHWFDFVVDDQLLTRMPLTVRYTRIMPGSPAR